MLAALHEVGPWDVRSEEGFQGDQAAAQYGEFGIEVEVFGAGFVLFENGVPDPVVADFAPAPMPTDELGDSLGASRLNRGGADVEGGDGLVVLPGGAFALGDREAAGKSQVGFDRFERVCLYGAFVEPAMPAFGLFGVGKRGWRRPFDRLCGRRRHR